MNILDAEAMIEAQKQLLNMQNHEKNEFKTLNIDDSMTHTSFSSTFFDECSSQIKRKIDKLLANTDNLKHIKQNQPNSSLKLFTFMFFSLLFPTQKSDKIKASLHINNSLLQTLKCSLYSKDINLTQQAKQNLVKESLEAKAMMARFLNILEVEFISNKYEKISLTDWMLERNPHVLQLFTIFFRNILAKLDIEDALEQCVQVPFSVAVSNLIEYFDISYRNFGEFFLVYQANYFLASVENELIIGQYFENEKKQANKKISVNIDQQQSFNIQNQPSQKHKKHHHLLEKEVKNFNFLLDSGNSSHILHQEEHDSSTPHFKQSYQLAFGKKKKEQEVIVRHQMLKKQFEKLIMDSDTQSLQQNIEEGEVSTPQLGKDSQQFNFYKIKSETQDNQKSQSNSQSNKKNSFLRKTTFNQVAIDELQDESIFDSKINPQQVKPSKNIVEVKDKNISTYSPQVNHIFQYECFTSFNNDAVFIGKPNKNTNECYNSSSYPLQSSFNPFLSCECNCIPIKKMKNLVVSKVVQFNFAPINKANSLRSPKFLTGLKSQTNINLTQPRIKITPPKDNTAISIPQNHIQNQTREIRTPAFLKIKKQKMDKNDKNSASSHSKSKKSLKQPSQNKQSTAKLHFEKQQFHKNFNNTRYSAILTKYYNDSRSKDQIIKSSRQKNESSSLSKRITTQQGASIKNFDSRFANCRPGLGYNWKSTSNFHQPAHQFTTKRLNTKDYQQMNRRQKIGETMKVYAPVHIIAPTVYFNGNYQNDNKVIFKVNDIYGQRQRVMEMKDGQKFSKNQNINTTPVFQSGPERNTNRCFKKHN